MAARDAGVSVLCGVSKYTLWLELFWEAKLSGSEVLPHKSSHTYSLLDYNRLVAVSRYIPRCPRFKSTGLSSEALVSTVHICSTQLNSTQPQIEEIHRRFPGTWDRIYLSGFSLGGNVIVKFLGEQVSAVTKDPRLVCSSLGAW